MLCIAAALSFAGTAGADPWGGVAPDEATVRGVVAQDLLPALRARRDTAAARVDAARAFFDGRMSFDEAFPGLAGADLTEPAAVSAWVERLDQRGVAREEERRQPLPDAESRALTRDLERSWSAAIEAEREADDLARRALYGIAAFLETHPSLRGSTLDQARAPLEAALDAQRDAVEALEVGPARSEALTELAALEEADARWSTLVHDLPRSAARGAVSVDASAELDALAGDAPLAVGRDALARLRALRSLVDEDTLARARAAEAGWRMGPLARALQARLATAAVDGLAVPEDELPQRTEEALAEVERLTAALAAVPEGDDPVHAARRATLALELDAARTLHEALAARSVGTSAVDEAATAAEAARLEAERARAAVGEHPAVAMRAESRAWSAEASSKVEAWSAALDAAREGRRERLAELAEQARAHERARDRVGASGPDPDAIYARLRTLMRELRAQLGDAAPSLADLQVPEAPGDLQARVARLEAWRDDASDLPEPQASELLEILADTRAALDDEAEPAREVVQRWEVAREAMLVDLREVKRLRHELRPDVTAEERRADRAHFGADIQAEVSLLSRQAMSSLRDWATSAAGLPARLLDLNWVLARLRQMSWGLFVLVVWWVSRRRRAGLAERWTPVVSGWMGEFDPKGREALQARIARVLAAVIDSVALWLVIGTAWDVLAVLGLLVSMLALLAAFRIVDAVIDVVAADTSARRPAFVVVSADSLSLAHASWWWLTRWWLLTWVLDRVVGDLLYADTLADTAGWLVDVGGLFLVVWLLVRWEPRFAARAQRLGTFPEWLEPLADRPDRTVLSPVRSLALGIFVVVAAGWDVVQGRVARGTGYNALVSVMDRVRFGRDAAEGEEEEGAGTPLDASTYEALTSHDVPEDAWLPREKPETALAEHFAAWTRERRQGVVVLTGDRGDGKSLFIEQVKTLLRVDGRPARIEALEPRLESRDDALAWLGAHFELERRPRDVDELIAAISDLPSQVHVVQDAQRSFLRQVGGFDALRLLLYVFNATSDRHFWVLSFHRPAWAYLSRLGHLVNVGVTRAVVDLTPLTGAELRELVLRRTRAVGLEVDFHRLVNTGSFSAPRDVEEERAIAGYFRLLAEAASGCPEVALHFWAKSLRPRGEGRADVVVIPELAAAGVNDLQADDMFVLAALRLQDRMSLAELCEVINQSEEDILAIVRELVQRGLVHMNDRGVRIDTLHVKAVTRTLRRRHFLQYGV